MLSKRIKSIYGLVSVLLVGLIALVGVAAPDYSLYLRGVNTIPSYCQETSYWCGAATGQMALEGYPAGVEHPFSQTHVWNRIQVHKDDAGVSWATDPDGLRDTLMELGGDPGVYWGIYTNSTAQSLMHTVTYWMARREYPTPVLVYGFAHWVLITGFTTDVYPTSSNTVQLLWVEIIDPWNPPCPTASSGGAISLMTGINWYSNYWYSPGNIPASKWDGNYVAIVEPPEDGGRAWASEERMVQGRPISADEAIRYALTWIEKYELWKRDAFAALRTAQPLEPLVANAEFKGYYIVPFGVPESGYSETAILLNAYTGEFQEVGAFPRPVRYLQEEEAFGLARRYLCLCQERDVDYRARLFFEPSSLSETRFLPIWEIAIRKPLEATVYVTQDGLVFDELVPHVPGD